MHLLVNFQQICVISGVKVLFKVAVILFRYGLGTSEQLKEFNDFHSIITRLKNLPEKIMAEDFLIQKVFPVALFLISGCAPRKILNLESFQKSIGRRTCTYVCTWAYPFTEVGICCGVGRSRGLPFTRLLKVALAITYEFRKVWDFCLSLTRNMMLKAWAESEATTELRVFFEIGVRKFCISEACRNLLRVAKKILKKYFFSLRFKQNGCRQWLGF